MYLDGFYLLWSSKFRVHFPHFTQVKFASEIHGVQFLLLSLKVLDAFCGFDKYLPLHSNMLLSPILSASLSVLQLSLLGYISKNYKNIVSNIRNI